MKKIIYLGVASLSVFLFGSCTKTILDINDNPNSATYSTPQLSIPIALENVGRISQTGVMNFSMWMGYTATNTGWALDATTNSYRITANDYTGVWSSFYTNLQLWQYINTEAGKSNLPLYQAISMLFTAYDYSCLVDLYNDVPQSDALLSNGSFLPKYDKGSTIYDTCVAIVDRAIDMLNDPATATTISAGTDNKRIIVFKGSLPDLTQWIKFANSLKLRLLLNQTNVTAKASYIQTEAGKINTSQLMGVGDDALADPGYINSAGKFSPYYAFCYSAPGTQTDQYKYFTANSFAIDFYQSNNDPRIAYFYDEIDGDGSGYASNDFGNVNAVSASHIGAASLSPTAPSVIMTAAEALFDQAEAIQRGLIAGDAKQTYNDAVKASFEYTKMTNADDTAAYYTAQSNANTNWDLATDKIKLIITQKWAALNNISLLSVYNDYRRTGFPSVPISEFSGHLAHVPYRLIYPQSEYNYNASNVAAEGTIDPQTDKVFWNQ